MSDDRIAALEAELCQVKIKSARRKRALREANRATAMWKRIYERVAWKGPEDLYRHRMAQLNRDRLKARGELDALRKVVEASKALNAVPDFDNHDCQYFPGGVEGCELCAWQAALAALPAKDDQ